MLRVIAIVFTTILSIAIPPLLVITIPLAIWYIRRVRRQVDYLRRCRDAYRFQQAIRGLR